MNTYTIEVTAEDIADNSLSKPGKRCSTCPVAKAMTRALGSPIDIAGQYWAWLDGCKYDGWKKLPVFVSRLICRLDLGAAVPPFTFTIEAP